MAIDKCKIEDLQKGTFSPTNPQKIKDLEDTILVRWFDCKFGIGAAETFAQIVLVAQNVTNTLNFSEISIFTYKLTKHYPIKSIGKLQLNGDFE